MINKNEDFQKELISLKADLISQEHRFFRVIHNFCRLRPNLKKDDPRRGAASKALLWYFLSPAKLTAAGISIVAILGLFFAYQANNLLQKQNLKIDIQNHLAEASRRSSLIFELTSIIERIDSLRDSNKGPLVKIPRDLIGRIVALSQSFRPYKYINYELNSKNKTQWQQVECNTFNEIFGSCNNISEIAVSSRPLSPERAQLFMTLVNANIQNLQEIIDSGADFTYSDFNGIKLRKFILQNVDFSGSSFTNAEFFQARFKKVDLKDAKFSNTHIQSSTFENYEISNSVFDDVKFENVEFGTGIIIGSVFQKSEFKDSIFKGKNRFLSCSIEAIFDAVEFNDVSFKSNVLSGSIIIDPSFNNVSFNFDNLDGLIFSVYPNTWELVSNFILQTILNLDGYELKMINKPSRKDGLRTFKIEKKIE